MESPNQLPILKSLESFEKEWVAWWSAAQSDWHNTGDWPLLWEDVNEPDWDELPNGGKDGLFLIVVTLGWWILARDPSKHLKLDDAIADVAWVIDKLIPLLSAKDSVSDSERTFVLSTERTSVSDSNSDSNSDSSSDTGLALAPPPKNSSKAAKKRPPVKGGPLAKRGPPVKIGPPHNARRTES